MTAEPKTETPLYPIVLDVARHMREHHGSEHPRHLFWHALANWLQTIGEQEQVRYHSVVKGPTVLYFRKALKIAMTYQASVKGGGA